MSKSASPTLRLGIDLGTTRTVVVASDRGRHPVASFDVGGAFQDHLPGVAAFADGRWWFGEQARARMATPSPETFAHASVKRLVSRLPPDEPIPGAPDGTTALGLLERYVGWVRHMLTSRSNLRLPADAVLPAMVAVPANAGTRQRYLTLEAFRRAGFDVLGQVGEPTAAAIEFAHREPVVLSPRSPKRYVVVYDLGGGTFDTAAVSLQDRRFELLTSEGIGRLGGADFDAVILDLVRETLEGDVPAARLDALPTAAALELCRDAKEGLRPSSRRLVVDMSPLLPQAPPTMIATERIYERCRPLIARTVALVDELFARLPQSGIDPEDPRQLGALYLVGGSVAFPPVARALRERYGRKIKLSAQPHAATATGLSVAADPEAEIRVREATTRHFGVWREAEDGREKIFDPILSKDALPDDDEGSPRGGEGWVVQRRYRPAHTVGHLRFLECTRLSDQGHPDGDLTPWQELRFPYDPALAEFPLDELSVERRAPDVEIVETYRRSKDGTITVEIDNPAASLRRRYVLGALR
ncbi:Hsp70 family protein [Paraliomyxa miuraensis]|uniref:Hsp70 family protein n=1 Tax=Paraliomyxa miuraensis TaxID=376150 RepID=UPI00224E3D59|nr:Hsp70 family protein [Paraliomyxa miuraensis]MCX4242848.1 Hsp70 family protein [Paraliomyxa miuraensis]